MRHILFTMALVLLFSCQNNAQINPKQQAIMNASPISLPLQKGKAKAYFASGCFWCVEAIFESVKGVDESISGYAGGHTKNPTYESNSYGRIKDHAEAVEIIYDPSVVSFATLVDVYFASQNPTQINGQGPDKGYQYRSIIFYQNNDQKRIVEQKKATLANSTNETIAAEIYPFQKFWIGEDYHQNYEKLHPNQSYIRNVSIPRLNRFKLKMPEVLKSNH